MASRSVSVASISRLKSIRDTDDESDRRRHRRSWSLGPFGRKVKASRPSSFFMLRRNTDHTSEGTKAGFSSDSRPHSWLGSGLDVSQAQPWGQQLAPTTYVDPKTSRENIPMFPSPPTTPPPTNSNGAFDSYLGVLPSPAPTSIHNHSQTDLRRAFGDEPPLPAGAQDHILRSVMRHSSPPVNTPPLQAVQGEDPGEPQRKIVEEDPDKTLTDIGSTFDDFKKEIDDGVSSDGTSDGSGSISEEVQLGTGVPARVIRDGNVSPVDTRDPTERESEVSPISNSSRNRERFELLEQKRRENQQIAQQNSLERDKEMNMRTQESESSDDEPTPNSKDESVKLDNGAGAANRSVDQRERQPDLAQRSAHRRGESVFNDGSSATVVDEDEPRPQRFSFEEDPAEGGDGPADTTLPQPRRSMLPPAHIDMPGNNFGFQHANGRPQQRKNTGASETVSLDDIVLTPTVQASQNPTPVLDQASQFGQQRQLQHQQQHFHPLQASQQSQYQHVPIPAKQQQSIPAPAPVTRTSNEPPVIVKREVRRDSPLNGYDAVPGARSSIEPPQRQNTLLQTISNAVVNGNGELSPRKGYAVRVVAAPDSIIQDADDVPPPPPPKDVPDFARPAQTAFRKGNQNLNINVLDVVIPSPSVSLSMKEMSEEAFRPTTPKNTFAPIVEQASPGQSVRTPPMGDETLVEDGPASAPSSLKRQKNGIEEAMVPLALHPAMRNSMEPDVLNALPRQAAKLEHSVTVRDTTDSEHMSDDDLYADHGGNIPPPSAPIRQQPHHDSTPSSHLERASSIQGPSAFEQESDRRTHATHKSKDSPSINEGQIVTAKNDRTWRNSSVSSIESRPMSFVTAPRDEQGRALERVDTISRKDREARERASQLEPKSLKLRERERRGSVGQLASHPELSPLQDSFHIEERAQENEMPIQRPPPDNPPTAAHAHGIPGTALPPLDENRATQPIIEPDTTYQPSAPTTSPKANKARYTPIVPTDPSQMHIAYQLNGYREATARALEMKLQADPNFHSEIAQEKSPEAQPTHRLDLRPKDGRAPGVSFFDQNADRFKLKGKAAGVFKVLGRPQVQEIHKPADFEPRTSSVSGDSAASGSQQRTSVSSQVSQVVEKKKRFSGMPSIFKRESGSNPIASHSLGALRMLKPEPKAKMTVTNGTQYQNVRSTPSNASERPYPSQSVSGRTSRQSDKYGEGNLLKDDDDEEDDTEEEHSMPQGGRGQTSPLPMQPLSSIHEAQQPRVSPIDNRGPRYKVPSPYEQTVDDPTPEPKYDRVSIPAAYDRSSQHLSGFLPRPPHAFEPPSPPTPPSAESPTWRRDPRDPFNGSSQGPPRKFSSDSYAAYLATESTSGQPSPPIVSPVSSSTTSPPAHRRLFGRGIVGNAKPHMGSINENQVNKQPEHPGQIGQQQERPWAITLPQGTDEEEYINPQQQQQKNKASQILGVPQPQGQQQIPSARLSNSAPPPGFRFAHEKPQPSQTTPPMPGYREVLPRTVQNSYDPIPQPRYPQPQSQLSPSQISPSQPNPQQNPGLQHHPSFQQRTQLSSTPQQQQYKPPSPQEPIIPPVQDKHAPLASPVPVQPLRTETLNDLDQTSFFSDATPASSAHPTRNSGSFPSPPQPGVAGVPQLPPLPSAHSPLPAPAIPPTPSPVPPPAHNLTRDSSSAPQVNANPRDSSNAPQVHTNPRDSSQAPQVLPPIDTTSPRASTSDNPVSGSAHPSEYPLPTSPVLNSPINPFARDVPVPPLPEELIGIPIGEGLEVVPSETPSTALDVPEGFAELSAVPKGEEEEEPVMLGVSYPGQEWVPTWED